MFRLLYLLFIISIIFGTSVYLGVGTPRQYMIVIMGLYCLFNFKDVARFWNKIINLYLIFIIFYGISSYMEDATEDYLRQLISLYLPCLIAYFVTKIYIKREGGNYNLIIVTILTCGIINSVVTILQYLGNPLAIGAGALFVNFEDEVNESKFIHMVNGDADTTYFGLLGNGVSNSFFTLLLPILTLYFLFEKKINHKIGRITLWCLFFLFLFCSFIIQERSPFLLALVMSTYIIWVNTHNKLILVVPLIILISIALPYIIQSDIVQNSRLFTTSKELNDDSRLPIYERTIEYLNRNLLFGGLHNGVKFIGNMPHNFVLNAFIYGGLFGGITVLYVVLLQIRQSIRLAWRRVMFAVPLAFLAFTLNGLTHNNSIVTGELILWILWAMIDVRFKKASRLKVRYE